MKAFFTELFDFNFRVNQTLADVINGHPATTPEKARRLFCHILNAHNIWNNRIQPTPPGYGVWEMHDNKQLKAINQANYEQSLQILSAFEPTDTLSYSNTKGDVFTSRVSEILFHIINHSTYHRGQVAALFRENGLEPPVTDYIIFKR